MRICPRPSGTCSSVPVADCLLMVLGVLQRGHDAYWHTSINCKSTLLPSQNSRVYKQVNFQRGETVTGTVVQFEQAGALLDIGAKTTAYMPVREVGCFSSLPVLR